jgi:curli biogenesis system outer membrane secretion channel CsgG
MNRYGYSILFLFLTLLGLSAQKQSIAVMKFEIPTDLEYRHDFNGSGLVEKIPTLLESRLVQSGKFELVERSRLEELINEQAISYSGLSEKEIDFGKLQIADYLVLGKITGYSTDSDPMPVRIGTRAMYINNQTVSMTVTVKLINTRTGRIEFATSEESTVSAKGRPSAEPKHRIDEKNIDDCAKDVVSKLERAIGSVVPDKR